MGKNALITPARFVLSFGSHKSLLSWSPPPHILTPHTTLLHVEFSAENLWGTLTFGTGEKHLGFWEPRQKMRKK